MAAEIVMPRLSDSMEEGTVARWLVEEGAQVSRGQPVVEIDTDKATMEYEVETDGTLLQILVAQGETVPIGTPIARIGARGETAERPSERMSLDDSGAGASETSERASDGLSGGTTRAPRVNASPIAKRIARKRGIDLSGVQGTGPSGMITKDDVERATTSPASAEGGVTEPAPLTRAQQAIARHMVEAAAVPTFSVEVEVEMSACAELRSSLDPQPSYNDLVVKACALALRDHPRVNASYSDGGFRYASEINVGIAVAAEDALLVPVIRQADLRSLAEIRTASRELVERARAGRLTPAELDGGTFTISNLGMHGMRRFEALLNTPQAAILAVGAVEPRPAVGPDAGILVRPLMSATLVCDHRILYGADAARFLARVRELLEEPSAL